MYLGTLVQSLLEAAEVGGPAGGGGGGGGGLLAGLLETRPSTRLEARFEAVRTSRTDQSLSDLVHVDLNGRPLTDLSEGRRVTQPVGEVGMELLKQEGAEGNKDVTR